MENEKENAEIFRQIQAESEARKARAQKLLSIETALIDLRNLLDLRERISQEVGSANRAADEQVRSKNEVKLSESDGAQLKGARSARRFREASASSNWEAAEDELEVIDRLIQVEKARQLSETASVHAGAKPKASNNDEVAEILNRIDKLRRPQTMFATQKDSTGFTSKRKVVVPFKPGKESDASAVAAVVKTSRSVSSQRPKSAAAPKMIDVRKSIDSIRRSREIDMNEFRSVIKEFEPEIDRPLSPVAADVIARETRDAAKVIERKRAALAALKLKPKPRR